MSEVTPSRGARRSATPLVVVVAAASAVLAALAPASPVGHDGADVIWCALLGAAVPLGATIARRGPLAWLGALAAVVGIGGDTTGQVAAVVSLAVVGVTTFVRQRTTVEAALLGAMAVQALLRGPSYGFLGLPTLVGAVALAPVAVSAWRAAAPRTRSLTLRAGLVGAGVVVVASAAAGVAALVARPDLLAAADDAEEGLDLVRAGDPDPAAELFVASRDGFAGAADVLGGPLARVGAVVPVVGQQVDALRTASDAGEHLADTAATTTADADYRSITPTGGTIDLDQVAALARPIADAVPVIDGAVTALADVRSPWLLAPISRELTRLDDELLDTADTARLAADGLAVAPSLLGGDGPRRYFVAFSTPAESRDGGGLVGAYAILLTDDGRLSVETTGATEVLEAPGPVTDAYAFDPPPDWQERYGDLHVDKYLVNGAASPDWPTDADVLGQLYPQTPSGTSVDGAVYADPAALAGLLALTGPIEVPGVPAALDAGNAEEYLLQGQYIAFGDDDLQVEARREGLGAVAQATFEALTTRPLPELGTVVDVLGPLVAEGHLRLSVADPAAERFLDEVGLSGAWTVRADADVLSVRSADRLSNKIDSFLHRHIDVDTRIDPATGRLRSTVTVSLRNDSPPDGLPAYMIGNQSGYPDGTNLHLLTLHSPHELVPGRTTIDGEPAGVVRQREFDLPAYSVPVELPPRRTRTLVLELEGVVPPGAPYRLDLVPQATANPDTLHLRVEHGSTDEVVYDAPLTERVELDVTPWAERSNSG